MTALALHNLDSTDHLVAPSEYGDIGPQSPALSLFTDFKRHEPFVLDGWMSAIEAGANMRRSHSKLRLVVDRNMEFIGTITLQDLSEANLLKKIAAGSRRDDIQVVDLMKHRHELHAISYDELRRSTVQDVIDTLSTSGDQHCLVVDSNTHSIRGLIAASDVSARLHKEISVSAAPTFAEIFTAVHA